MNVGAVITGLGAAVWAFVFIFVGYPGTGIILSVIAVALVLKSLLERA